jgi:DNA-binding PadR family transcriptional regulator/uncharacterized protein (UPF0335 family)
MPNDPENDEPVSEVEPDFKGQPDENDPFPPEQGPPHHGPGRHHHHPGWGRPERPDFPGPFPHYGPPPHGGRPPPFFMTRESFTEIKHLMVLMLLADKPEGITGYQLQEQYSIPRGNLIRTLEELEQGGYVATRDAVENGRNQKYYIVTNEGNAYVERLKESWASQFTMLSEMAPPDTYGNPFMRRARMNGMLERIPASKDDAIDYFHGLRYMISQYLERLHKRIERLEQTKAKFDEILAEIEQMDPYDVEVVKALVKKELKDPDSEA